MPPVADWLCDPSQYDSVTFEAEAYMTLAECRDVVYPLFKPMLVPPYAPFEIGASTPTTVSY